MRCKAKECVADDVSEVSESDASQQLDPDETSGQLSFLSSYLMFFSFFVAGAGLPSVGCSSSGLCRQEQATHTNSKKETRDATWSKIQERIDRDTGVKFSSKTLRNRLNKLVDGSALPHKELTADERTTAKEFG